jgi:hypothetical protein
VEQAFMPAASAFRTFLSFEGMRSL